MHGWVRGMVVGVLVLTYGAAMAQDGVLYCSTSDRVGYALQGSKYERTGFEAIRFTLKLIDGDILLAHDDNTRRYKCSGSFANEDQRSCHDGDGYLLNYNTVSKRFVFAQGFGYYSGDNDTVSIAIGTCAAF